MRIHYLQHVPFESPERIQDWAMDNGHELAGTLLYENTHFPFQSEFDMLVILGGPMGVYDEDAFPWLVPEKEFIRETIRHRKLVLGICLGAQLIAEVMGGKVYRNQHKEIGWHPVQRAEEARNSVFFRELPEEFAPFHWHADTFELELHDQAKKIASSKGCANQAFEFNGHVIGLQFHLESSNASIKKLIEHCAGDMEQGIYVQSPIQMINQTSLLARSNAILVHLLDTLERNYRYRNEAQPLDNKRSEQYRIIGD